MTKNTLSLLLAATLSVAGCVSVPVAKISAPAVVATTATLRLTTSFVDGKFRVASLVDPYTQSSISHLVIALYTIANEQEAPAQGADGRAIMIDLPRAELGNPITISQLHPNTLYRVRAMAYKAAGTAAADLISTTDSSSYVDVTVGTDDRPTMSNLSIQLIDMLFAGQTYSNGVVVLDGAYSPVGPETFSVGTVGTLQPRAATASMAASATYTEPVRIGNRIYLMGRGNNAAIQSATIQPDGPLTAFATVEGLTLNTAREMYRTAVIGKYLYVFGGLNLPNTCLSSIERSEIAPDGTLGAFTIDSRHLAIPRRGHGLYVGGGKVYILGGIGPDNADIASIEAATINADGTLGAFAVDPTLTLPSACATFQVARTATRFYAIGGDTGTRNQVWYAPIARDGSLGGTFQVSTSTLSIGRGTGTAQVIGDKVYVLGGFNVSSPENSVEVATIGANDVLGNFSVVDGVTLTAGQWGDESLIAANSVYVFVESELHTSYAERAEVMTASGSGARRRFSNLMGRT